MGVSIKPYAYKIGDSSFGATNFFSFQKGYPLKYRVNKENSNRNVRFGNTVLSQ